MSHIHVHVHVFIQHELEHDHEHEHGLKHYFGYKILDFCDPLYLNKFLSDIRFNRPMSDGWISLTDFKRWCPLMRKG
jgi:hypothetical protein